MDLYEQMTADIDDFTLHNSKITKLFKKITLGTATYEDVYEYSARLGDYTTDTFRKHLNDSNLSEGKQAIARVMADNYDRVNDFGCQVQEILNQQAGLGLNALPGEYNADRVYDLAGMISNSEPDRAREFMGDPVVNTTQSYVDALLKANADFHYQCGLVPVIRRQAQPDCCPWCKSLEGTHEYPVENENVYHRHERCKCTCLYYPVEGIHRGQMQDVWSKRWYTENGEALKTFNL